MTHETISANNTFESMAAGAAILCSIGVFVFLGLLHALSPEFDPSWRMVSEYADGRFRWILSLMFLSWAASSWSLAFALRRRLIGRPGRIGLFFLAAAGVGEAMAAAFDINHPLHGPAAFIGIGSLPVASILVSAGLARLDERSHGNRILLWTAHLPWVSLLLMGAALAVMMTTFSQAGGAMEPGTKIQALPPGVIAVAGWTNRFLIICYVVWIISAARQTVRLGQFSGGSGTGRGQPGSKNRK